MKKYKNNRRRSNGKKTISYRYTLFMNVLSLFDGISCGMVALKRNNFNVENYFAYEIDRDAITVSKSNFPKIKQMGDVTKADFTVYENIDLLLGGSPCQDLCGMGSREGLKGSKSSLFFHYVRALKEAEPKYFLFENNASMTKEDRDIISGYLGVQPIFINSADFSAQTRKRLYWTNIPVDKWGKKDTRVKDILYNAFPREEITFEVNKYLSPIFNGTKMQKVCRGAITFPYNKTRCVVTESAGFHNNQIIFYLSGKYYYPNQVEFERLQTLPDFYTSVLAFRKAVKCIGNGWTVDVIAHLLKNMEGEKTND